MLSALPGTISQTPTYQLVGAPLLQTVQEVNSVHQRGGGQMTVSSVTV